MSKGKTESVEKAKPQGNADPKTPDSPDVKQEGWSAEEIAEQASNKDATEVKGEMKQGKKSRREDEKDD